MKQKIVVISLVILLLGSIYTHRSPQQFADYPRKQARLQLQPLTLIVANTEQRKITGLLGSKPLKNTEGMLFQFPAPGRYGFWMKDMYYSLDIIYLRNNVVVEVKKNVSPETFPDVIVPANEFNAVIEVVAGMVDKNNIRIGDKLVYN